MTHAKRCDTINTVSLQSWIQNNPKVSKRVLIGFDGYVDSLYRVVSTHTLEGGPHYYRFITDFGQRVMNAAGKSADIEIAKIERRLGGNAPLMADGMAMLGDEVTLIGEMGYPQMDPSFLALPPSVKTYSYAEPCQTIALEFSDGKIMMGDTVNSYFQNWDIIKEIVGEAEIQDQVVGAELIAILNWSAHRGVPEIANRIADIAANAAKPSKELMMFFDLSDPNTLPTDQLLDCLSHIAAIGDKIHSILGMNENEARTVIKCLFPKAEICKDTYELACQYGRELVEKLNLQNMTIHATDYALGFDREQMWRTEGFHVEKPLISTGGGDHYNAAFCHGMVHGLPMPQCLLLGCAASSYYVSTGNSADRTNLIECLNQRKENSL